MANYPGWGTCHRRGALAVVIIIGSTSSIPQHVNGGLGKCLGRPQAWPDASTSKGWQPRPHRDSLRFERARNRTPSRGRVLGRGEWHGRRTTALPPPGAPWARCTCSLGPQVGCSGISEYSQEVVRGLSGNLNAKPTVAAAARRRIEPKIPSSQGI